MRNLLTRFESWVVGADVPVASFDATGRGADGWEDDADIGFGCFGNGNKRDNIGTTLWVSGLSFPIYKKNETGNDVKFGQQRSVYVDDLIHLVLVRFCLTPLAH